MKTSILLCLLLVASPVIACERYTPPVCQNEGATNYQEEGECTFYEPEPTPVPVPEPTPRPTTPDPSPLATPIPTQQPANESSKSCAAPHIEYTQGVDKGKGDGELKIRLSKAHGNTTRIIVSTYKSLKHGKKMYKTKKNSLTLRGLSKKTYYARIRGSNDCEWSKTITMHP